MFQEFFRQSDLLAWPLVALAIFFTAFVGVLVRMVLLGRRSGLLSHLTALPLADDERPQDRREVELR